MNRLVCTTIASAAIIAAAGSALVDMPKALIWNASASAPIGLYAVATIDTLEVSDFVAAAPPEPLARFLEQNGYLPRGVHLLKRVAGLPGQTVCRSGSAITVDGVDMGETLERDRHGRALPVWQGCRRIASTDVFLMNFDVRDSLDGRYFGPLPRTTIIGRAIPLYTDENGDGRFVWRAPSH